MRRSPWMSANSRSTGAPGLSPKAGVQRALFGLCLAFSLIHGAAAAGSWVASAPSLRVTTAERESLSAPLKPPPGLNAGEIYSVAWRFEAPPGSRLRGRLCQANTCVVLEQMRGQSRALAGLPATGPLRFHFSLAPNQPQAVVLRGLQLIVNYL